MSQDARFAASVGQIELISEPRCNTCGHLGWTVERFGRLTHKCGCKHRTDNYCQAHPNGCDTFTDIRTRAYQATHHASVKQLVELPGTTFEDIFVCGIDESAGLREDAA